MVVHPSQPVASLRRSVVGREPAFRHPFVPRRRWRMPRGMRRFLIGLLLLLVLLVALNEVQKPIDLANSTLVGPRLVTGPICIEEAVDVSGSMTSFTPEREQAERELFTFARRELNPNDQMSAAFFAGSAELALTPSPLDTLTAAPAVPAGIDSVGTRLAPAVQALVNARNTASDACVVRALVVITDGEISDPGETASALALGSYARVYAVIPAGTGWGRPEPLRGELNSVSVYHFNDSGMGGRVASVLADAKPLDVVLGDIVGSLTGQRLEQNT